MSYSDLIQFVVFIVNKSSFNTVMYVVKRINDIQRVDTLLKFIKQLRNEYSDYDEKIDNLPNIRTQKFDSLLSNVNNDEEFTGTSIHPKIIQIMDLDYLNSEDEQTYYTVINIIRMLYLSNVKLFDNSLIQNITGKYYFMLDSYFENIVLKIGKKELYKIVENMSEQLRNKGLIFSRNI